MTSILDGYTEEHEIDGVAILLRPFTRFDRKVIGETLNELSDLMANRLERRLVLSRIVDCESDPLDLYGERLWELAMGVNNTEQEIADETNLSQGVFLVTRYPWMERTTCGQCRQWLWNPFNGQVHRNAGEPPLRRLGDPPCEPIGTGDCPRGHWSEPRDLSAKNKMAWRHFKACEATATFPDDPIVRRNARVIRDAVRRAEQDQAADGRAGGGGRAAGQLRNAGQRAGQRTRVGATGGGAGRAGAGTSGIGTAGAAGGLECAGGR